MSYVLKIKELLRVKKITQKEFSELIDKNVNTVSNYFTGKTKIDIDTFIKIAKVLNVPIGYFFDENTGQTDNKEFDEFLNELLHSTEMTTQYLFRNFAENKKNITYCFYTDFYELGYVATKLKNKHLFKGNVVIANIRKKYLFDNIDIDMPDDEIVLKRITKISSKIKQKYITRLNTMNEKLVSFLFSHLAGTNKASIRYEAVKKGTFTDMYLVYDRVTDETDGNNIFKAFQKEFFGFVIFSDTNTENDTKLRQY